MPWTAPTPWTDNMLVTAAIMNQQVRDNLSYLKAPPYNWTVLSTGITTTSTTPVDITGASLTFTTAGGDITASFTGVVTSTAGASAAFRLVIDGTPTSTLSQVSVNASLGTVAIAYKFAAAAGSHTVKAQWWNGMNANAIFLNIANSVFIAGEFT